MFGTSIDPLFFDLYSVLAEFFGNVHEDGPAKEISLGAF